MILFYIFCFLMRRRPPRSTRTDTLFPTRRSSDLQDSARALSMFPGTFRAFVKQRVRWSRNSYRCYLTAIRHGWIFRVRSEEHTSELQSLMRISYAVFCLKKKNQKQHIPLPEYNSTKQSKYQI